MGQIKDKFNFLFIIFSISTWVYAHNEHFPIVGGRAKTTPVEKFNFQYFPGSNGASTSFAGAISLGITENLEIGTIPVYYYLDAMMENDFHLYNFIIKYNFVNKPYFQQSLGYTFIHHGWTIETDEYKRHHFLKFNYFSLISNWTPVDKKYNFSFVINKSYYIENISETGKQILYDDSVENSGQGELEYILEANHIQNRSYKILYSLGYIRYDFLSQDSFQGPGEAELTTGLGFALTEPVPFINNPTFAAQYFWQTNVLKVLISTQF
jgi:hypothetical protein